MPLPTWALVLMLLPAMGLLLTIIAIPFVTLQYRVRFGSCVIPFGPCAFLLLTSRR